MKQGYRVFRLPDFGEYIFFVPPQFRVPEVGKQTTNSNYGTKRKTLKCRVILVYYIAQLFAYFVKGLYLCSFPLKHTTTGGYLVYIIFHVSQR